jgi:hypothetical protein
VRLEWFFLPVCLSFFLSFFLSSFPSQPGPFLFLSAKMEEIHTFIIDERSRVLMFVHYEKQW